MGIESTTEQASSAATVLAKATPPLTVSGFALSGVQLNDLVLLATLIYTVAQLVFLIRDRLRRRRGTQKARKA